MPTRWFHIHHPVGFSPEMFDLFRAQCRLWRGRSEALLANWEFIPDLKGSPKPEYEFHDSELSGDRLMATLPLGGDLTLAARSLLEEEFIKDTYAFFPVAFRLGIEVGKTEPPLDDATVLKTRWWNPNRPDTIPQEGLLQEIRGGNRNHR